MKSAIAGLANGKSADEDGAVIELLKSGSDDFSILLLEQYNSGLTNFEPDPKWLELLFQMRPKVENVHNP